MDELTKQIADGVADALRSYVHRDEHGNGVVPVDVLVDIKHALDRIGGELACLRAEQRPTRPEPETRAADGAER